MMKTISLLFSLLLLTVSDVNGQPKAIEILTNPVYDIETIDIPLPIHKSTSYRSIVWGSDYGDGNIYKSTNNGRSFKHLARLGAEYFESIQFLDQKNGFVCGDYGYVYKTNNGGKTWQEISPEIDGRIKERFRNDTTKNQKPDGLFVAYYSMHFTSVSSGYVSGFSYNPKIGFRESYERIFFVTEDGGKNWKRLNNVEKKNMLDQFKKEVTKENIAFESEYFLNNEIGWKLAKDESRSDIIIKSNYPANTTDTVKLVPTPFERAMLRNIVFLNSEVGFVFGGSLDKENEKAVVYFTVNGGHSWEFLATDLAHIHSAISNNDYLFLFGKEGLMKRIPMQELVKM